MLKLGMMSRRFLKSEFSADVERLVKRIPSGRVMTYGQVAALCGKPRAARAVGGIAHFGAEDVPWHRVVSKSGQLASGYWGGRRAHREALMSEGIEVNGYVIDIERYRLKTEEIE